MELYLKRNNEIDLTLTSKFAFAKIRETISVFCFSRAIWRAVLWIFNKNLINKINFKMKLKKNVEMEWEKLFKIPWNLDLQFHFILYLKCYYN